jgi:thioredoxin reductase
VQPTTLPIAVIGAGPIGLAAAAHLVTRGETPLVLEAGPSVGASVRAWGHVRLFSPWRYCVDATAAGLLADSGWTAPEPQTLPTGRDLVERYLEPLAALPSIAPHLRLGARVMSVARLGFDKLKSAGREQAPFELRVRTADGTEESILAKAVVDASGTYRSPNPLGAGGLPAGGEADLAEAIYSGIPDVLGVERRRYAGRRVLVIGSGHSAFNALLDLVALAAEEPATRIAWAIRRADLSNLFGGEARDLLPARGDLGGRVRRLVEDGTIPLYTGFRIASLARTADGIVVSSDDRPLPPVDEIVATTGFRPDLTLTAELRLGLDPVVESPAALAELIDPNVHSCGTVPPHGAAQLAHPEPGFYTVGMKSYGSAPTFLLLTGYEQVRSVACALVGDAEGAATVKLELPETGVCSVSLPSAAGEEDGLPLLAGSAESACCGSATPAVGPRTTSPLAVVDPPTAFLLAVDGASTTPPAEAADRDCCSPSCCEPGGRPTDRDGGHADTPCCAPACCESTDRSPVGAGRRP